MEVIIINETMNANAKKLMHAFLQFRKIHWKPPHIKELKPSEFMVLHTVKNAFLDGTEGLMVSEISDLLKVARPTVTQLVNSLQRKGFIEKQADEKDKRVVRISLSEKGKTHAKQGSEEFYKIFDGLADHLGTEKSKELTNLLQDVFNYFQETESQRKD